MSSDSQATPTHASSQHLSPDELARAVGHAMYEADACSRALGFELVDVRPGYACMRATVRPDFLNGHAICHGGLIFTLADSTFAFACNSYNVNTVASGCSIEFLRPVHGNDVLTAEAVEQTVSGRTGIYDIRVTNRAGETVALFRGKSAHIKGHVIPPA
ncbi:phenylacetic acid degradation protein PaaD [Trinickia dabaoshanensis]|uniref:Phenylacetic acid degradation protein PaaD n=1 Tax=Trinickia dabaoshanensis TaxID=564714 RepID=A0A2N7VUR9_9BURK|nr:hydroxyphenylacetyl-CoA thioesterase PaaI [Trinickia dabaoshanensis]PMS20904.1 phenylacetic acid degradation protein PaaD [Trinickia dabaoshanensis]